MATAAITAPLTDGQVVDIPVEDLRPHPRNIRKSVGDPLAFAELCASIRQRGNVVPLIVLPDRTIVAGHRRYAAGRDVGRPTLRCLVRDLDEAEQIVVMLDENVHRGVLSAMEEAGAYQMLLRLGRDEQGIASAVGVRPERVRQRIMLSKLPAPVVHQVEEGSLPIGDAMELARLLDYPRELERLVKERSRSGGLRGCKWLVDAKLGDLRRRAKRDRSRIIAKNQGLTLIPEPRVRDSENAPLPLGKGPGQLDVDVRSHRALSCHAVFITRDGTTRPACRTPKESHADACPPFSPDLLTHSASIAQAQVRRERQAQEDARLAAAADRTAAIRRVIDAAAGDTEVCARMMLWDLGQNPPDDDRLVEVLGLAQPRSTVPHERRREVGQALQAWLLEGVGRAANGAPPLDIERAIDAIQRAFTAWQLLEVDRHLIEIEARQMPEFLRPLVAEHLRLLRQYGCPLTPAEAALIRKDDGARLKAAAAAERKAARARRGAFAGGPDRGEADR